VLALISSIVRQQVDRFPATRVAEGNVIVAEADGRPVSFVLVNPMDGMLYSANISVVPLASDARESARYVRR
jgi:hypothetical protein